MIRAVDKASKTNSCKTNQADFFCVRQVYFTNSCQQIWGCVNQPFILFIHHIWGETVRTIYHTDLVQNAVFHSTDWTQSMFRTINRGLLAKPFKKFPNHPFGRPVLVSSASCQCGQVFEWTLIELRFNIITNLLLLFFVI